MQEFIFINKQNDIEQKNTEQKHKNLSYVKCVSFKPCAVIQSSKFM